MFGILFGIFVAILFIHYTTFMDLWWWYSTINNSTKK